MSLDELPASFWLMAAAGECFVRWYFKASAEVWRLKHLQNYAGRCYFLHVKGRHCSQVESFRLILIMLYSYNYSSSYLLSVQNPAHSYNFMNLYEDVSAEAVADLVIVQNAHT